MPDLYEFAADLLEGKPVHASETMRVRSPDEPCDCCNKCPDLDATRWDCPFCWEEHITIEWPD